MKLIVLIICLFSPVHIQPQATDLEEARRLIAAKRSIFEKLLLERVEKYKIHTQEIRKKENYTDILQQEWAKNDEKKSRSLELQNEYEACNKELQQCRDRIQGMTAAQYQQQIDAIEKETEEILREKNEMIPLLEKQNEEKKAILNRLNNETSKLNELKKEKEKLLREIEMCKPVSNNSTVFFPGSSTLSGSKCFLNNLIDFKSSLFNNLFSSLFGLDRKMN